METPILTEIRKYVSNSDYSTELTKAIISNSGEKGSFEFKAGDETFEIIQIGRTINTNNVTQK